MEGTILGREWCNYFCCMCRFMHMVLRRLFEAVERSPKEKIALVTTEFVKAVPTSVKKGRRSSKSNKGDS